MKINQLKAGVVLTYLSTVLGAVISLVYTPFMLNILGQGEYGIYTLVNSVVANLGVLSFGFSSAYIRFFAKYKVKDDHKGIASLNGMFMTVFLVIGIIALLAGSALILNIENIFDKGLSQAEIEKATVLMKILVVNIAVSFPASVITSYITANEKYIFLKAINMIKVVFSPLMNLPILLLGYGSVGMVLTTLIINLVADAINIYFAVFRINMRFNFRKFDFKLFKETWAFSFFIFLNILTDQINWNVDKFLLGIYQSSVAIAVYGVAAHLNNLYNTVSTSVSHVFIPRINKMVASGQEDAKLTELFTRIGRIQFLILAFILIIYTFFGKYFISVWAGNGYEESYYVGLILLFSVTIADIQNVGIEIQRAKNLHKFRSVTYFLIALGNLLLSIPMCINFGAVGAAVGTAISLVVGNGIIMNIYYHKKVNINIITFWKNIISIFPAFIIPVIYGITISKLCPISDIMAFILQVGIMFVLYALSIWAFAMNKSEKNLLLPVVKKLFWRKK